LGRPGSSSNIMYVAWAEAYLHAKFRLHSSNRLTTIHQRYRQTDRQTDRQDNGLIAFGEPFCKWSPKTVRPMPSDGCLSSLSVLSVCDFCVLWPIGWMDQDATWYGGRPRPRGDRDPDSQKGNSPQFSAHVCSGQTAGWIKMTPGTE